MRIIESIPQWSPYPHGTNAVACTETMQSIDHAASFFMDIAPGDAPPLGPPTRFEDAESAFFEKQLALCNPTLKERYTMPVRADLRDAIGPHVRFGETIPVQKIEPMEFRTLEPVTGPCSIAARVHIETCAPNAREWLESDGIPEAIGDTDHEDTKPAAPRNSTPVIEDDRERYPGKSLAW